MQNKKTPYLFITPFTILVTLFYIVPAIFTIAMAFTNLNATFVWKWYGLNNFRKILIDPNTSLIIKNTIVYVGFTILITLFLDLLFAILTTYFIKNQNVASFFKSMLMIPMITPSVVYGVLWIWLLDASKRGVVNQVYMNLSGAAEPVNWIVQYPMQIVIAATVLTSIAFGTINFSSAIKSIPEDQFKAARVDGASEWEIIKSIILPNIRYHISFIALWETLGYLTNYVTILLITDGGPSKRSEVWALSAYHKAFVDQQYGYGAAISLVLIIIVLIIMTIISNIMQRREMAKVQ
jgi:inositol-phosphate transport system permease protein